MLSRILRDEQQAIVQAVPWKRAGGAPAAPSPAAPPATQPTPPAPAIMHRAEGGHFQTESGFQEQINGLRRQMAEMEAAADRRVREAHANGYREGEMAARGQVQPVIDKLGQSIRDVCALRPRLRHEAEIDVIQLALAIAKRILHRELSADPESVSALIHVAMEKIRTNELVRVRVHPQHHAAVQHAVAQATMGAQVEIRADASLPLGGVVVETTRGEFDASVETQLREIERGLTDRLAHGAHH